jgi:hypothetical protein
MKLDKEELEHRVFVLLLDIEQLVIAKDHIRALDCVQEALHYKVKGTHYEGSIRWWADSKSNKE